MTRRLIGLVALLAALAAAPAASAANFTVNDPGDATDPTLDGTCDGCTLREAIDEANALAGTDSIDFTGITQIDVPTTLAASDVVTISGSVTLRGTGADPILRFNAGTGGSQVTGLAVTGGSGDGIVIGSNAVRISQTRIYGNAGTPIVSATTAPQGLRIGPRRADNSLPLTGSTDGGILELFSGSAFGSSPTSFLTELTLPAGGFSHLFSPEPAPMDTFSATVTNGPTSNFTPVTVPFDVVSPGVVGAVASSTTQVRVQLSEPVDPASINPEDFLLEMAGEVRAVSSVALDPTGAVAILTSSGWGNGEAGFVQLTGAGALADTAGNASLATTRFRVAAAPGDFLGPVGSSMAIRPKRMCLTRSRTCRRTGGTVRFISSEPGRARLVIMRGNKRVGEDPALADAGRNAVRFNGVLRGRKLRAGSYRMLLYIEDAVGNETEEPPIQRFQVRRVAPGRRSRR